MKKTGHTPKPKNLSIVICSVERKDCFLPLLPPFLSASSCCHSLSFIVLLITPFLPLPFSLILFNRERKERESEKEGMAANPCINLPCAYTQADTSTCMLEAAFIKMGGRKSGRKEGRDTYKDENVI